MCLSQCVFGLITHYVRKYRFSKLVIYVLVIFANKRKWKCTHYITFVSLACEILVTDQLDLQTKSILHKFSLKKNGALFERNLTVMENCSRHANIHWKVLRGKNETFRSSLLGEHFGLLIWLFGRRLLSLRCLSSRPAASRSLASLSTESTLTKRNDLHVNCAQCNLSPIHLYVLISPSPSQSLVLCVCVHWLN